MKRIRIGKDISMRWEITTDGAAIPLEGRDLTVEIKSPMGIVSNIPFRVDGNILIMTYYGYEQKRTGEYSITLWEKKGKPGQNVVDVIRAFELVRTSPEEDDFVGGDLQIESVDLGTENFDILTEGGYRAINIDTLHAEALEDSVNIKGKTYSNESFTITLPKANLDSAGVMSASDVRTLKEHADSIAQIKTSCEENAADIERVSNVVDTHESRLGGIDAEISSLNTEVSTLQSKVDENTTSISQINNNIADHEESITQINTKLEEHTESINAKITTERIEDGAVTSEKIATSAFDSTLSVSGKIAPADVVGEKITDLETKVTGFSPITKTISWSNGYVNSSGNVMSSTNSLFSQPFLLKKNEKIIYKTIASYTNAVIRVTNDNAISVGDQLSVVDLLIEYKNVNVESSYTATEDMYIVVSLHGANYSLSFEATCPESITDKITELEQKSKQYELDIANIEENIESITGSTKEFSPDWSLGFVSGNKVNSSSSQSNFCQPFKLLSGQMVKFGTAGQYSQAIVAIESGDAIEVGDILSPIASVEKTKAEYGYVEYTAENDCYIICSGYTGTTHVWIITHGLVDEINTLGDRVTALENVSSAEDYGNYTQFIGFKRAMQQVLLKWTPKNPVPKRDGTSFPANVKVSGLIYSETMEIDKRVGWDVSLLTFMTAVNNPYSLLYTENISATRSQSAYGITYHGDGNSGAYYGSVCNTFAMLGVCNDISYTTPQVWEERTDLFFKVYNQSIRGLELMDLVGKSGHVLLVTKLVKDKYGVNVGVYLSEEAGATAITRPVMNETQFASFLLANGYSVMRFKEQYKNIIYTPSKFVAVLDEVPEEYTYNNDICTIYGDYASILEGDLLHINYTKGTYTQMNIYKDDNLAETILLSSDASIHDINLAEYGFTYGKYKACLSDGTNDSDFTHWELIRIEMSLSVDELTFSVSGGNALYWDWQKQNGGSYIPHLFDKTQKFGGSVNVAESGRENYNYCIKVHAQGDYGRVAKRIVV